MASLKEVQDLIIIMDKALSFPAAGVHIGEGIHVNMPESWDGTGEVPEGWTLTTTIILTEEDAVAFKISDNIKAELLKSDRQSKLTETEKLNLNEKFK